MPKDKPIKKLKLEHIPLHCPVCGTRFMNMLGRPLPNHSQVRCATLDGNEMDLGICQNCIEKGVSLEMLNAILEGIKDFWCHRIDLNRQMETDDRIKHKGLHRSHVIENIIKVVNTTKQAERRAIKKGLLQ